jgi:hypothetical protein
LRIERFAIPAFSSKTLSSLGTVYLIGFTLLAVALCGCGYSLAGQGSNLPEDIKKIFVETLANETSRSQVEQILTQSIAEEMVTRRRFNVVNSAAEADAVLRGKVIEFSVRPLNFDEEGLADNFEISATLDMVFERNPVPGEVEGEVVWNNPRYVFRKDYPLEEAGIGFFDRENLAIEEMAEEFAKTLITDLLEGF